MIQNISVNNKIDIPVKDLPATLITIEISYNDGLPEVYQLPMAFVPFSKEGRNKGDSR